MKSGGEKDSKLWWTLLETNVTNEMRWGPDRVIEQKKRQREREGGGGGEWEGKEEEKGEEERSVMNVVLRFYHSNAGVCLFDLRASTWANE